MPHASIKSFLYPVLAILALSACDIPTEPKGIHEESMTLIGEKLQQQGDDASAMDFYQRSLQRHPHDVEALRNMGTILENHGNIEAAETYYTKALQQVPNDQPLLHAEGRVLIRLGRAGEARDAFQKILTQDHHDVKALNGMGIASDYLGQHDAAEQSYRTALEVEPNNLTTVNNLAHSYVLAGKYGEAISLLEPFASDKASTPALRQNLAEAYGMSGMYTDAERMARMDLKPKEVKRNLAYYRAHHAKIAPEPKLAADLGAKPTHEMAEAEANRIMDMASDKKITVTTIPEVGTVGGTPSFALRATGFHDAAGLGKFCDEISKAEIECKAVKK